MPTFQDPVADGEEARQALRGLAHATRTFHNPQDTYEVIGELLAGVRSLGQVLEQLANAHLRHQVLAHVDGDGDAMGAAGVGEALAAVDELRHAARLMDAAGKHLDMASQYSGRITWYPASPRYPAEVHEQPTARLSPAAPFTQGPTQFKGPGLSL